MALGMWNLSSPPRDWTCTPCIGIQSLNHWTAREIPKFFVCVLRHSVVSNCLWLGTAARQAGKNTGAGCHALLWGIFPTQGSNPGLLHCRWILYHLRHQGSPRILEWLAYPSSSLAFLNSMVELGLSVTHSERFPSSAWLKCKVMMPPHCGFRDSPHCQERGDELSFWGSLLAFKLALVDGSGHFPRHVPIPKSSMEMYLREANPISRWTCLWWWSESQPSSLLAWLVVLSFLWGMVSTYDCCWA